MRSEHWGTLSVRDHLNTQAMVADLLIYDRLVFPVLAGDGERVRWREEGWEPEKQEMLIERLGVETAVKAPWDDHAQRRWSDLRKARDTIEFDAYQVSRMVLAMDQDFGIPDGVKVRAIAAYHDDQEAKRDLGLERPDVDRVAVGKLAYAVGRELLVPNVDPKAEPLDLVLRTRDLAQTRSFRAARAEFNEWLESEVDDIARGRSSVDEAVQQLRRRATELNHPVRAYFNEHKSGLAIKSTFAIVSLALPHALGLPEAAGTIGMIPPAFELLKFAAEEAGDVHNETKIEAASVVVAAGKLQRNRRWGIRLPWNGSRLSPT